MPKVSIASGPIAAALGRHQIGEEAVDLGHLGDRDPCQQGRHVEGAALLHQLHRLGVHVGAVLDRAHAGADSALHPLGAVGVRRDVEAVVVRGLDDGPDLLLGELRVLAVLGDAQDAAGGGDLDQVGALLVALAHTGPGLVGAVHDALVRPRIVEQLRGHAVGRIGVAAGGRR